MEEDLERTEWLIEEWRVELEAAEAVAQDKRGTIGEAESYRDRLRTFLESEVSEFWSRFGEGEAGTPTTSQRPVPTLNTTFEGLQKAKKHLDRMRVYALGNSGRVVPREAAELLISLGLSDSQSARDLAKNLATAMSGSKEFIKETDKSFVLVEFFSAGTDVSVEQLVEQGSAYCDDSQMEGSAAPDSESGAALA